MDATLDSEDIALLNRLSDKQKDYALTLYTAREKKKIHRLHPVDPLRRVLLLPGPPLQEHTPVAPLLLRHRRNLVDHRPLPHVRHGEEEKQGNPDGMHQRSGAALPRPAILGYLCIKQKHEKSRQGNAAAFSGGFFRSITMSMGIITYVSELVN